jgi:hypothetical protein
MAFDSLRYCVGLNEFGVIFDHRKQSKIIGQNERGSYQKPTLQLQNIYLVYNFRSKTLSNHSIQGCSSHSSTEIAVLQNYGQLFWRIS